ncbi:ras and EF-hand domain-containing protein isoform X2 [Gouania willdenowi]|uniref:ras and EF-hand domain-containing protein isoform X2 n=1 Tax=Gouania willdenowi TaxID=441366 RepID=UPI00105531E0|nr:ras and EF-hand domain-containing protein-like isoform X2 [Gouania willdenowi]
MEPLSLRRLFSACDVNKSGRIEYEDFTVVCRELSVPEADIQALFGRFDASTDGFIDFDTFSSRFQEVSDTLDLASFGAEACPTQGHFVGEEFVEMVGSESVLSDSLREQLSDLHQAIHSCGNSSLLQMYEEILQSLISHSTEHRQQFELLESSLKRAEERNHSQLAEMEEDIQLQLTQAEERVRDEEQRHMERVMMALQKKYEQEVADLQAQVDKLFKSHEDSELSQSKEELLELNRQISELSQEKQQLQGSLLQAQTNMAVLHSELDKLKNKLADQKARHQREAENLRKIVRENQSYSSQIELLQEINKKMYDSNDGLRSTLATEMVTAKRRLPLQSGLPARRMKPLRQSTLIHTRYAVFYSGINYGSHKPVCVCVCVCSMEQECTRMAHSRVSTWADRYLDSGVSLPMDTPESSGNDYDSDDSRSSVETVHHSYSYVPSDAERSEVKSEAAVSLAPSRGSSIASSLRRRLSAFSSKCDADMEELEDPGLMYRLVLAGDAGAGKSSFLMRLTLNEFRGDMQTTLGVDFQMKKMLVDGEKTRLQIWDTAGQERFRSIARSYFRKAHGVLLVYDVTSESSFLNVRSWVDQIQDSAEEKISMCVIGNKVDLREELPQGRCVSSLDGERLAKAYGALFCETSAKEGTNIVEAVLHLAREVKKNATLRQEPEPQVTLNDSNVKQTFGSCCGL